MQIRVLHHLQNRNYLIINFLTIDNEILNRKQQENALN